MSTYGNNKQQQDDSFLEFIHRIPFYGNAILCGDDKRIQLILDKVAQFYTYGFADENDLEL